MGVYPSNSTVIVSAPNPSFGLSILYDPVNQSILAMSLGIFSSYANAVYVFSAQKGYTVTFKETGLPQGSAWILKLDGVTHDLSSSSFSVSSINGTLYSFTAENTSLYYASPYSGSETINGATLTVSISYLHWAYIHGNFTQQGLNVAINGVPLGSGSSSIISFNQSYPAGTYVVEIYGKGYVTQYDNFTLTPGQAKNVSATLKVKGTAPGLTGVEMYAIIGGVGAAIAVAGGLMIMRRKR